MAETKTLPVSSSLLSDEVRAILHLSSRRSLGITSPVHDWYWSDNFAKLHSKSAGDLGAFVLSWSKSEEFLVISSCNNVFYPSQATFDSTVLLKLVIVINCFSDRLYYCFLKKRISKKNTIHSR